MRTFTTALMLGAFIASPAFAQGSATLNRFAASETVEDDFHLSRPTDFGHLRFGAQLHLDYANDPLVWLRDANDTDSEVGALVAHQLNATVGLSFGIFDRVVVYAGLPVTLLMQGDDADVLRAGGAMPVPEEAGLGDIYLGARARLFGEEDDMFALGLQATVTFPTSGDHPFRGDESFTFSPELLLELRPGAGSRIVANIGARIREDVDQTQNLSFDDELTYGLGFAIPVWTSEESEATHLDLHVQGYGTTSFQNFFSQDSTAVEVTGGAKFFHQSGVVAGLAGGAGLTRGFGAPDVRIIGMLGWAMPEAGEPRPGDRDGDGILDTDDSCPDEPEDVDNFEDEDGCPDPDNDNDGILDTADNCPMEPETANGFEDEDGCPDEAPPVDTDGDGILDSADACPTDPEDVDGFEDEDGCPDPDNDGDGIPDTTDNCPMEPEDVDTFEDEDGCPDPDNDEDGVLDVEDNCPLEAGSPDNQGCRRRQQVRIVGNTIEILDKVYFRTNRDAIQPRSFRLLQNVAQVLNNHLEIEHIRVEGHTDSRGGHAHNVDLSQRRAQAVVDWLTSRGNVEAGRLEARGYGPDRPIVENASSRSEHAQNRRVEFHIVGASEGIEHSGNAASEDTID